MQFEKDYFEDLEYSQREHLVKRHILDVLRWGTKESNLDLLNGKDKRALDVGCAYGYAVEVLSSLGYDVCGVDLSKYGTQKARNRMGTANLAVTDVQKGLPFRKGVFDLATCFDVLEHLRDPIRAIKNIYFCCRSVMIYTTPNRMVEKPFRRLMRDLDATHINVRSPSEWESSFHDNLQCSLVQVDSFIDVNLRVRDRLLFFKSLSLPYFGLDVRIVVRR